LAVPPPTDDEARLGHSELVFQLGFKMKLVEKRVQPAGGPVVRLHPEQLWQAGNEKASSAFHETNDEPEFIATVPLAFGVLGVTRAFSTLVAYASRTGKRRRCRAAGTVCEHGWDWSAGDFSLAAM
jgi:hypothetical protein